MSERTRDVLAAARARGRTGGQKPKGRAEEVAEEGGEPVGAGPKPTLVGSNQFKGALSCTLGVLSARSSVNEAGRQRHHDSGTAPLHEHEGAPSMTTTRRTHRFARALTIAVTPALLGAGLASAGVAQAGQDPNLPTCSWPNLACGQQTDLTPGGQTNLTPGAPADLTPGSSTESSGY
ncbi:hypothetical protein AB0H00_24740 [Nocardia sp. NPDC023852]|uniref:hypothetical protein n=1 Tax=Nocardia sp. NPDC023852 TaxID=3154697 RepID=UPI0033F03D93